MSIAVLLNAGKPAACAVSESDPSFAPTVDFTTACRSYIYQLLVWLCFAHPRSRNASLIHTRDFCNPNELAFREGISGVDLPIDDLLQK